MVQPASSVGSLDWEKLFNSLVTVFGPEARDLVVILCILGFLGWWIKTLSTANKREADRATKELEVLEPIKRSLEAIPLALEAQRADWRQSIEAGRSESRQLAEAHRRGLVELTRVSSEQAQAVRAMHEDVREMRQSSRAAESLMLTTMARIAQQVDTVAAMTVRRARGS